MSSNGPNATPTKKVAVCGATGRQGGAVLEALLAQRRGYTIRALTRNPASPKATELASKEGVEVVQADFDDPASLRTAFAGCDAVFGVTDFWHACGADPAKEKQQGMNIVDAAKAKGVGHLVLSTLEDTRLILRGDHGISEPISGYYVPHFDAKADFTARAWEAFGPANWTCVYPSIFYENLLPGAEMAPRRREDGSWAISLPTGAFTLSWCSTEQIGAAVATAIADGPEKWGGKLVGVVGDYARAEQVAEAISEVAGVTVVAETPPVAAWVENTSAALGETPARDLGNMFEYYVRGNKGFLGLRPRRGDEQPTLQEWLEAHAEAFREGLSG
jgi:uncharacterized protein YbjT (DUF2867 family)